MKEDEKYLYFDVPGAGIIQISKSCHHSTGGAAGFSFAVDWGRHGLFGGVLGRGEAIILAEFILNACLDVTETEIEEVKRVRNEILNRQY